MSYRVLVVDDSALIRRLVSQVLSEEDDLEVVGTAANGELALAEVERLGPDLVTMDIEMPVLDGLQALVRLRRTHPRLPVVMMSSLTQRGASVTLEALERGADDYVAKPSHAGSLEESRAQLRDQLVGKVRVLCDLRRMAAGSTAPDRGPAVLPVSPRATSPARGPDGPAPEPVPSSQRPAPRASPGRVDVLVVGASTGGPDALARVIPALPAGLPVPVLVVQHMPPVFTSQFAARLDSKAGLRVTEAGDGEPLRPGHVLIAPGGHHLTVRRGAAGVLTAIEDGPPENYVRPAVDVLFRSVVASFGAHVLAVVLTGMGSDGAAGAGAVRQAGGFVVAQDEASSVVWGMPGAVVSRGDADQVLPLDEVARTITTHVLGGRRTA